MFSSLTLPLLNTFSPFPTFPYHHLPSPIFFPSPGFLKCSAFFPWLPKVFPYLPLVSKKKNFCSFAYIPLATLNYLLPSRSFPKSFPPFPWVPLFTIVSRTSFPKCFPTFPCLPPFARRINYPSPAFPSYNSAFPRVTKVRSTPTLPKYKLAFLALPKIKLTFPYLPQMCHCLPLLSP